MEGYVWAVQPFDTRGFAETFPTVGLHKNNPTLLYYNKK